MNDDVLLLRRYAEEGDQNAFCELVRRHLGMVFATALRQVNDRSLAEDVAQSVFLDLARHAAVWEDDTVVAGWLYRATRFAAAKAIRTEQRRRERETVFVQNMDWPGAHPFSSADAESLSTHLDAAIGELSESDRDAIVLRFFESLDFRAIGEVMATTDDTAQKRVTRALEKLRLLLSERGVALSAAALAALLTPSAQAAPPATLATTIAREVAGGAVVSAGGLGAMGLAKTVGVASTAAAALVALGFLFGWHFNRALNQPTATREPGLVASWSGDGHSQDAAGHHTAIAHGNVTYAQGVIGQAFHFDGTEGTRLVVPDAVSLNLTGAITLTCWVRPDEDSMMGNLVAKRSEDPLAVAAGNAANYGLQLSPPVAAQWGISQYFNDVTVQGGYHLAERFNGTNYIVSRRNLLEQLAMFPTARKDISELRGQWHHLVSTFRQVEDGRVEMALYFDGQCYARNRVTGSLTRSLTPAPLSIGGLPSSWFKGRLDEIRIYNRVLVDAEIQALVTKELIDPQGGVVRQAAVEKRR